MADATFFVSGGTLPLSAGSYVERAADRALLEALGRGRYAYVLNARQMGKSSLCVRTIARLEETGVRTAFVDLTRIGGRNVTPDQWYVGLLGEIGRGVGGRAEMVRFWKENPDVSPMQRFFGALVAYALPEGAPPLVVFVDEVDATRSLPFSADEFFGGIRECYNRRAHDPAFERLTFCLLGAAIPSDLIRDMEASPFNVGERIAIKDFTPAEALAFASGLGAHGKTLVERVHYWTGGHPFLTQSLCARLAGTNASTPGDVDRLVAADLFAPSARESNVNLADVGNRVLLSSDGADPDRHRAEILALYDRVRRGKRVEDDESNERVAILKLAGLVVAQDGLLQVRNRVYARVFGPTWIAEHTPDGEARRVRKAYRVGLLRAAAAGGAIVLAMAGLTGYAVAQTHEARLAQAAANRNSEEVAQLNRSLQASSHRLTEALGAARANLALAQRRQNEAVSAKGDALLAAKRATASAHRETLAHRDALLAARRANASAGQALAAAHEAGRQTLVAREETHRADLSRDHAEALAYASDMQIASLALAEGNGAKAAQVLEEARPPHGRPSWAERHYRAVLNDGQVYGGHRGGVGRVAFAPNGDLLTLDGFSMSSQLSPFRSARQGRVRRWSKTTGRLVGSLGVRDVPGGLSIDVTPDGKTVAVTTVQGPIRLFSTDGFRPAGVLPGNGQPTWRFEYTEDPDRALGWQGPGLWTVDLKTGRPVDDLGNRGSSPRVTLLPDGGLTQIGRYSDTMRRFERLPDGRYQRGWWASAEGSPIAQCASSSGNWSAVRIAYADTSGNVQVLDEVTGDPIGLPLHVESPVRALAFDDLGERLAVGLADGTVKIVKPRKGALPIPEILSLHHGGIDALAFTPAEVSPTSLAIGTGDGTAIRRELASFDTAEGGRSLWNPFSTTGVSHDGRRIVVPEVNGIARLDPKTGDTIERTKALGTPSGIVVSSDGAITVAVARNGHLSSWSTGDLRPRFDVDLTSPGGKGGEKRVALSPDGKRAVVYDGGNDNRKLEGDYPVRFIDVQTGRDDAPPLPGTGYVAAASFSPDGRRIVVAWQSGVVRSYDGTTGRLVWSLPFDSKDPVLSVAYAPDSHRLALGRHSGQIDIDDAGTGKLLQAWPSQAEEVFSVAFTPDGTTLLSGGDALVRFWDCQTWRSLGSEPVPGPVKGLVTATDGTAYCTSNDRLTVLRTGFDPISRGSSRANESAPAAEFAAARARAQRDGRSLLIVLQAEDEPIDGAPGAMLLVDPEALGILRRHFEIFEGSGSVVSPKTGEGLWKPILGDYLPNSMHLLGPDGRLLWNDRPDSQSALEHGHAPIADPSEDWEVETFLRVLRKGSPSLSDAEVAALRRILVRNGSAFAAQAREASREKAENDRMAKLTQSGHDDEAWAILAERRRASPLRPDVGLDLDAISKSRNVRAGGMAAKGQYRAAANLLVGAMQAEDDAGNDWKMESVALYGLAKDVPAIKGIRRLFGSVTLNGQLLLTALVPGVEEDLVPLTRRVYIRKPSDLDSRYDGYDNVEYEYALALANVRMGRFKEAEDAMREEVKYGDPIDVIHKIWVRQVLALALAHEGRKDEARFELGIAQAAFPGDRSDAALLARRDRVSWAPFVFLRREIIGLIGGEDAATAYARAGEMAGSGQPKAAADLLVRTMRAWGNDPSQLQFALALYGVAGDLDDARALRDLVEKAPNPDLLASLVPGAYDDPAALLKKTDVPKPEATGARENRAMLILRAGRYAEAEAEMRSVIRDRAADLAAQPVFRRWAHQILSLALAYEGKKDEARAELAAANVYTGDTSDAGLLKLGQSGPTTFVLLRREILEAIGKR